MLKIVDGKDLPYVNLAETSTELGQWVVTLGHSGGYELGRKPPIRTGRVLGKRNHQLITDAVLIGGDSGGPLFDLNGDVIGIHSSIGDSIAENRHVTVDTFRKYWTRMKSGEVWGQLPELSKKKKKQQTKRARMGVVVNPESDRALVREVHANSPAAKAGIRVGDIITRFDNQRVENGQELIDLVKTKRPNQGFYVEIQRKGYYFSVYIVLEEFK